MKTKNTKSVNTHGISQHSNPYWEKNVGIINNHLSGYISQIISKNIGNMLNHCINVYFTFGKSCLVLACDTLNVGWWNGNTSKRNFLIEKNFKKFLLKKNRFKNHIDFDMVNNKTLSDVFFHLRHHLLLIDIDLTKNNINDQLNSKHLSLDNILLNIPESFIVETFTKHTINSVDYYSGVTGLMKTHISNNPKKFLKIINDDIDQLEN
jgi:hypothetical protein